tara:strand:+ start:460 stop:654 length:195 start_codon:yes stop_codon:yes gene_type:complete
MDSKVKKVPPISQALIDWLKTCYPALRITPNTDTIDSVWFKAGQQQVIQFLETELEKQTKTEYV